MLCVRKLLKENEEEDLTEGGVVEEGMGGEKIVEERGGAKRGRLEFWPPGVMEGGVEVKGLLEEVLKEAGGLKKLIEAPPPVVIHPLVAFETCEENPVSTRSLFLPLTLKS
jgi:hypothetical protein